MARKWRWLAVLLGGSWLGYRWTTQVVTPAVPLTKRRSDTEYAAVPTLFIPGWGGNAWTYNGLLRWLARRGYGHKVLTVTVSRTGVLHFTGTWTGQATNPLIQVLFTHSFTTDYQQQIRWITAVLRQLRQRYGITSYNVVAHSWGGSAAVSSLVLHGPAVDLPRPNRLILLGTPVDESQPTRPVDEAFERLRAQRANLQAMGPLTIYNVYGTLLGRQTDGSVPVTQVQALRQVVVGSPVTYREHHVPGVSHSQLHASPVMWRLIARLLWSPGELTTH